MDIGPSPDRHNKKLNKNKAPFISQKGNVGM